MSHLEKSVENNNKFLVRSATMQDLPILLKFEQGVISAERPFDPTLNADPIYYYDLADLITSENAEVVVVELNSKIIASGYALKKKARHYLNHEYYAYLGFMFTHSKFRGKGVNKLVIDRLKTWSKENGLLELRLTVYDENSDAIKAYEKAGFKKHIIEMRMV